MQVLFIIGGRFLVGMIFILSGFFKLKAGYRWFNRIILSYDLVRGKSATILAILLPVGEVLCGTMLFVGFWLSIIVPLSFGLLLTFNIILSWSLLAGQVLEDCGCFGRHPKPSHQKKNGIRWSIIYRNQALMGILVFIAYSSQYVPSLDNWFEFEFLPNGHYFMPPTLFAIWISTAFLLLVIRFRFFPQQGKAIVHK